jgi:hypothetical protein
MAKRTQTFSVRLEVEDGGKVKAVFVDVGKEGQQAFKKIEKGSKDASGGLGSLTDRARSLSKSLKLLAVVSAGVAAIGGIAVLTKKSIEAADALAKTADKLGVNVEALQELRFAAQLAGVEQNTFDMGLQRFIRRVGEAAKGTGEAKEALETMGIALRDNNGNVRAAEDLLNDVADALKNTEDPAERLRLAFKLFDSEGVALVNVLAKGSDELEKTRQRARDLGIVLDEDLIRNAENAKDQLDTLSKVVSANLSQALLGLAPLIADASSLLAELASDVGIAFEKTKLFFSGDFKLEGLSLRGVKSDLEDVNNLIASFQKKLEETQKRGDGFFIDQEVKRLQRFIDAFDERRTKLLARYQELQAQQKALEGDKSTDQSSTPDNIAQEIQRIEGEKRDLENIRNSLDQQLFDLTTKGAERIRVETEQLVEQIKTLKDVADDDEITRLIGKVREVESLRLSEFSEQQAKADERAREAAEKRAEAEKTKQENIVKANEAIIQGIKDEISALGQSEKQNFIDQAVRRLSAEATETQRQEVEKLAAALFDEKEAAEEIRKEREREAQLIENIVNLTDEQTGAQEKFNKEIAELIRLRKEEKITAQQLAVAEEDARRRMLAASRRWIDGVERALRDYEDQATDSARNAEEVTLNFLRNAEDAFVSFSQTGKFEFRELLNSIVADINRALIRENITGPISEGLNTLIKNIDFKSIFSFNADGNAFVRGAPVQAFASGGIVNRPTVFPMANGAGLMGEAGPEAILPLRCLPSGRLGVETTGASQPSYTVNVDARGATDPAATAAQVGFAVDKALNARIPGIVRASSANAKAEVIDTFQRRGGRFD